MPALSQAQQRLMGLALHDPDKVRDKNKEVLTMKKSSLKEFASTPRSGLPKHAHPKLGGSK